MKEISIVQIIKNKSLDFLKPVNIVYGSEHLLKKQLVQLIKEKTDKDIHILWGDETEIEEFYEIFSSGSLFSSGNIAIIFNADIFLDKIERKKREQFFRFLEKLSKEEKDSVIFILNKEKVPSKEPYKSIIKYAQIIVSNKLTQKAFLISLKKKIQNNGKKIDDETLKYLADKLKNSLEFAKQEVEKLLVYTEGKDEITKEDIDAVVTPKLEENIFSFVLSFLTGDKKSIKMLDNLLETGYHPFEIQALILSYLNKSLVLATAKDKGEPLKDAFEKVGIKHQMQQGVYKKILSFQTKENLINMIRDLYELEIKQKTQFEDIEKKLKEFILKEIYKGKKVQNA